ncbi:nitrate- and nitrite sensing domain-containing protein [Actinokineospora sp. PR83]|uniref:sensor histidine kinase n=1 Tax=Actinokineospora sp. PR83 TaxID=2884908 RepID=UPI0027E074BA|nr:nitrate- and nitrite sensing domain-containing protein [Actinokineospora sp. PR83]MCG8920384.1 nitrate- and nitrite sensing domain-containing protein [Actinokineospora sp. PR83]
MSAEDETRSAQERPDGGRAGDPAAEHERAILAPKPRRPRPRRDPAAATGAWRPRNWRLRTKMTVVLLVPALTAAVFGWLRVQTELDNADGYQRIVDQVDVSQQVTATVHALQHERALVVTRVAAGDKEMAGNARIREQFTRTDEAVFALRESLGGLRLPDAEKRDRYQLAFDQLRQLDALRQLAQGAVYPDLAVLSSYNTIIDPLVQLGREISTSGSDSGPSRVSTAVQTLGQAKERGAQLDALLLVAAVHNTFGAGIVQNRARSVDAGFDAAIADFVAVATPDERQTYNDGYSGPEVDRRRAIAQTALSSADPVAPLDTDVVMLSDTSVAANDKLRAVETNLIARLRAQAESAADSAIAAATRDAAIVVALLVLALGLMFYIAWSILTPIRTLRREALDVARVRLPETVKRILDDPDPVAASRNAVAPVAVSGGEEIGQLARSFDAVHEQAVRMATEQAVLRDNVNAIFVNLSRRSQALIERQLAELDQLEQNEQDPDQLGRFFVLDHLAARMRRNSENLLILSGSGLAKRMARPVPVGEVVESALSEVEHYTRVRVKQVPDLLVQGRVVKDLVHLIAELLDNAATFSAPDTQVLVSSARVRSGEVAIQISDEGMGMSDEELEEANERLADPPDFDVSLSRRMGLYVVARLAQRHAIRVRLHGGVDAGTTAVITLPADLMATPGRRGGPATNPGATGGLPTVVDPLSPTHAPGGFAGTLLPARANPDAPWFKPKPQESPEPDAAEEDWRAVRSKLDNVPDSGQGPGALPRRSPAAPGDRTAATRGRPRRTLPDTPSTGGTRGEQPPNGPRRPQPDSPQSDSPVTGTPMPRADRTAPHPDGTGPRTDRASAPGAPRGNDSGSRRGVRALPDGADPTEIRPPRPERDGPGGTGPRRTGAGTRASTHAADSNGARSPGGAESRTGAPTSARGGAGSSENTAPDAGTRDGRGGVTSISGHATGTTDPGNPGTGSRNGSGEGQRGSTGSHSRPGAGGSGPRGTTERTGTPPHGLPAQRPAPNRAPGGTDTHRIPATDRPGTAGSDPRPAAPPHGLPTQRPTPGTAPVGGNGKPNGSGNGGAPEIPAESRRGRRAGSDSADPTGNRPGAGNGPGTGNGFRGDSLSGDLGNGAMGTHPNRPGAANGVHGTAGNGGGSDQAPGGSSGPGRALGNRGGSNHTPGNRTESGHTPGNGVEFDRAPGDGGEFDRAPGGGFGHAPGGDPGGSAEDGRYGVDEPGGFGAPAQRTPEETRARLAGLQRGLRRARGADVDEGRDDRGER